MGLMLVVLGGGAFWLPSCGGGVDGVPNECDSARPCADGMCIMNRCVANTCNDPDGDGAGDGPSCAAYDCDEGDPTIPADREDCNERDDDCDGARDEGCPCLGPDGTPLPDGHTRSCGRGGECAGTQTCSSGVWTVCEGGREPTENEICFNEIDDNCNGEENEFCCPEDEFVCPDEAMCSSNGICS